MRQNCRERSVRRMRALVVYESMFGNTQVIARAIAEGWGTTAEADLREVGI